MDVEREEAPLEPEKPKSTQKLLTPKQIQANILAGEKWLKSGHYKGSEARWAQWERNKKYLLCVWPDAKDKDVNVNTIFSNYNTIRPTLYFKNPKIIVKAAKPTFERDEYGNTLKGPDNRPILVDNYKSARLLQVKLNYELKEIKFKKTLKKVLGDALCPYGIGWVKVGYSQITVGGHNNDRSTAYQLWVERVDPRNLVYHWLATDNDKNLFTAERLIMTKKEALEHGFKLPENYVCSLPDFLKDRTDAAQQKEDGDLVIAWEYHDHMTKMIYWTLVGNKEGGFDEFLKEPVHDGYPFEGSSYVPLVLNENNDDIIGLSDVEPVEDQALAINRIRTKQTKHIEWFGTKTFYGQGAILDTDINKVKTTDHGHWIKVQDGRLNEIKEVSPPSMGRDDYQMDTIHKDDMRLTLGITDYMQGGAQSRTATEGNIIQNASNVRIEERRDIIYDFVIEVVRRLVAMIQEFSVEEDYLNLSDEEFSDDFLELLKKDGFNPEIPFLRMSREDIQGEFNFDFNVEEMIVRPKEIQLQQWTNLLGIIGQSPLLMKAVEEEGVSMRKVVRKVFELAGADIEEVKAGGPVSLSVEQENQMFLNGMEVPDPHPKDKDDEHIIGHSRVLKELEGQIQMAMSQAESIMGQAQNTQAMANPQDPSQMEIAQRAQMKAQEALAQIEQQTEPIQNMVRKLKLHNQAHDLNRQRKEMSEYASGGMPMPQGQPGPSQQVQMQQQAQQVQ